VVNRRVDSHGHNVHVTDSNYGLVGVSGVIVTALDQEQGKGFVGCRIIHGPK
jgi:hypothetical protein